MGQNNIYTEIVLIHTTTSEQQKTVIQAAASEVERWGRYCPGFLSSTFHSSEDELRVVNYAQWRSRTDWEQFVRHPEGETLKRKMLAAGVDWSQGESRGYSVVRSIGVPDETQKEQ